MFSTEEVFYRIPFSPQREFLLTNAKFRRCPHLTQPNSPKSKWTWTLLIHSRCVFVNGDHSPPRAYLAHPIIRTFDNEIEPTVTSFTLIWDLHPFALMEWNLIWFTVWIEGLRWKISFNSTSGTANFVSSLLYHPDKPSTFQLSYSVKFLWSALLASYFFESSKL